MDIRNIFPSSLKTKPVVYQDMLQASDSPTLEQIKELSSKRKAIEESINGKSFTTEAIAREISGGLTSRCAQDIQKIERYLPLLGNMVHHIKLRAKNRQVICWITEFKIRWTSMLNSSSILHRQGSKFYQINDMYFELGMTLFLYGALLHEQALEVLSSDLVQSAALFRKAAGVYDYLAQEVLVNLHCSKEKPPEAIPGVSSVMSLICLADAQAVTARKAAEKGNTGGLLAKLHYGIKEFLVEAINILQVTHAECNNISSRFQDFILCCKTLHELKSYRYLSENLKIDGKHGVAVGVLHLALANAKKTVPREDSWRLIHKREIDESTKLLKKYEHENEFVYGEKTPCNDELPLPQGVKIVKIIPYEPQKSEATLVFKL